MIENPMSLKIESETVKGAVLGEVEMCASSKTGMCQPNSTILLIQFRVFRILFNFTCRWCIFVCFFFYCFLSVKIPPMTPCINWSDFIVYNYNNVQCANIVVYE